MTQKGLHTFAQVMQDRKRARRVANRSRFFHISRFMEKRAMSSAPSSTTWFKRLVSWVKSLFAKKKTI